MKKKEREKNQRINKIEKKRSPIERKKEKTLIKKYKKERKKERMVS